MSTKKKAAPAAPRPLPAYSAEVESHRAAYARVAEALALMLKAHGQDPLNVLDVEPNGWVDDEPEPRILWDSIEDHLRALFETVLITYTDEFLRTLYVELRLFVDERQRQFRCGMYAHRRRES